MFDKRVKLKDGQKVTIEPVDQLTGLVKIDFNTGVDQGVFLGGGLSGNVMIPEALNEPSIPKWPPIPGELDLEKNPIKTKIVFTNNENEQLADVDDDFQLAGNIVPPHSVDNVLITLLDVKKTVNDFIDRYLNNMEENILDDLYQTLENKFKFNMDYMNDYNVSNRDKINDVKGVVDNNLEDIRNVAINLQSDFNKEDSKGL